MLRVEIAIAIAVMLMMSLFRDDNLHSSIVLAFIRLKGDRPVAPTAGHFQPYAEK